MKEVLSDKEDSIETRVYSSDKRTGVAQVFREVAREMRQSHALGLTFAIRSFRSKYRQSFLGVVWAVVPSLLTAAIWIMLQGTGVIHLSEVGVPYPAYVITGIMLWSVFSSSVLAPLQTMQANRAILVKINFPKESIFFNAFYEVLFSSAASVLIIIAAMLYFGVMPGADGWKFLPCLLLLMGLGIGIGLLLMPFALLFRDLQYLLPSVLQLGMYLTPVLYAKPAQGGLLSALVEYNPVASPLLQARASLLGIESGASALSIGIVAAASCVLLAAGVVLNRVTTNIMIERMGS